MTSRQAALRSLPAVQRLQAHPALASIEPLEGRRVQAARTALADVRAAVVAGAEPPALDAIAELAAAELRRMELPSLRRVINATGVVLHTNLGRAPLSRAALAAMGTAGDGYSNLEFDLETGARGTRFQHLEALLQEITGAGAGIAVNNNAAAVLLTLSALCQGREVIVSRGQAVEIGGGFRIPDVLRQSGAQLVEVGTTNRTHLRDFAGAISERTAAILRVHASNFRVTGFTSFPELDLLSGLAHERGVLMLDDLGSGCLLDTRQFGMLHEPTVQESIAAGTDVVAFSGDKLLGGPQAGILVGRTGPLETVRRHPMARALRIDKSSIAALEATLRHYQRNEALREIPIWRAIATPLPEIARRARRWARAVPGGVVSAGISMVGGGSLPEEGVETRLLALRVEHPNQLATDLRRSELPVVARIAGGAVLLDPRTVEPADDPTVIAAVLRALSSNEQPGRRQYP
jgi:L-seryl-tRNA(Ser) seleniumtransferase